MKLKHLGKGWEPRIRAHSYQLRLSSETSNPATSWGSRSRRRNDGWYAYFEIFILKNAKIGISMPWAFIYIELAAQTKYLIRKLHHKTQYRPNSPHLRQNLSYSQLFETSGLDLWFNTTKFDQKMIRKKIRDLKLRKENPNNTCPHRRRWSVNGLTCDPKKQDTAAHPTAIQGNSKICDFVFILFNFLRHFDIDAFDWYWLLPIGHFSWKFEYFQFWLNFEICRYLPIFPENLASWAF
jgi:hypothetical protein